MVGRTGRWKEARTGVTRDGRADGRTDQLMDERTEANRPRSDRTEDRRPKARRSFFPNESEDLRCTISTLDVPNLNLRCSIFHQLESDIISCGFMM